MLHADPPIGQFRQGANCSLGTVLESVLMAILIVCAITFSPFIIAYFASDLLYAVMAQLQLPRKTP